MSLANNVQVPFIGFPLKADKAYRYLWVQPQSNSTTLSTIQAQSPSSVSLGNLQNLTPEVVFIGKIIIQYTAANWRLVSVEKLIGNKVNQQAVVGGSYLSVVTTDNTLTGNGTTIDPLKEETNLANNQPSTKNHQGVVAFLSPISYHKLENIIPQLFEDGKVPFILLLDRVTDFCSSFCFFKCSISCFSSPSQ